METVASRWAGLASDDFVRDLERISWSGIPQVHLNHNYLMTGDRATYWVDWIRDRFFHDGDAGDALSLGCGAGHLDRILKSRQFRFRSFTGMDISAEAIARARGLATDVSLAPRIEYVAADLNTLELPPRSFDFIYFFQALHHIEALEHALDQCVRALRPGGVFLVNEFVGPSRFQWTDLQLSLTTQLLRMLPEELRRDLQSGGTKFRVERPSIEHMRRYDPSEAVRSEEIDAQLKQRFSIIGEWNWGGTLNHLLFQNIAANFDPHDPFHCAIVDLLIEYENALVAAHVIPSDFKVYVARART